MRDTDFSRGWQDGGLNPKKFKFYLLFLELFGLLLKKMETEKSESSSTSLKERGYALSSFRSGSPIEIKETDKVRMDIFVQIIQGGPKTMSCNFFDFWPILIFLWL